VGQEGQEGLVDLEVPVDNLEDPSGVSPEDQWGMWAWWGLVVKI